MAAESRGRRPHRSRTALRRARDEHGAVVPIVAILVGLLITVSAFTVDLGQQRVARTDMQSLSDLVALDTSRLLGGQTTPEAAAKAINDGLAAWYEPFKK